MKPSSKNAAEKAASAPPAASPLSVGPAAVDLAAAGEAWLRYLGGERRASAHTLSAYQRDLTQFLQFLAVHLGKTPSLTLLAKLATADLRAFLASRRQEGVGSRSLLRQLAGLRSFTRYLERNGKPQSAAFAAVRAPKAARRLPKP